jgi:hypothetical protein
MYIFRVGIQQTVTFAFYITKSFGFITQAESVYRAVRNESLYNTDRFCRYMVKEI